MLPAKTSRRDQLTIAFAAATLVLLVVAAFGTVNYYRFYPAITQVQARVTSLQTKLLNDSGTLTLQFKVGFSVNNPSNYNGFSLSHFESTYDVVGIISSASNTTLQGGSLPDNPANGALNPGGVVNIGYAWYTATTGAARLASQPQTKIQFVFNIHFVLSSFLDKVTTVIPLYRCTISGGSADCQQVGITLVTAAGGSGGGGGGGGV